MPSISQHFGQTLLTFLAQFRIRLLVVILLSLIPLHADETKDLQKHLQERLVGQVFTIRNFYGSDHLIFDGQGKLIEGDTTVGYKGCWSAARIEIQKAEVKKDKLILRGPRVIPSYDFKKGEFSKFLRQNTKIEIDIKLDFAHMTEQAITGALEKVFLNRADDLISLIPDAWRATGFIPATKEFFQIKPGITQPKAIYSPDPEYSEPARKAKIQGNLILWLAIDEQGNPVQIKIVQCLGWGLDDQAVNAASKWKFVPAQKDGQPVPAQIEMSVEFHLY